MTIVVDSSVVVAALIDDGPDGEWASAGLRGDSLAGPAHLYIEVSSVIRRRVLSGQLSEDLGALVHREAMELPVDVFDLRAVAGRVWALHSSVTPYDAAYVALAEELGAPLWTLDRRLARANGPRCTFVTGPA
ncbi:type II toxin-antitoxin system VapC family toxin [Klenkia sp. PcliD-1-E]|uniref:type II toxin-antitoxin system VapC family toxin n=1 Tax=Klenkia sp. PcliD-1-E TaxID=2954492 RepID=UPI002097E508|nr:type II toxin-antitoxin system VapC family toxin [Klenkia sp. PcliD-1-E]MCO7218461.1 type II toxin-antitoxin system VapC family toxin [Klenkia sp. PcliD-1-E]